MGNVAQNVEALEKVLGRIFPLHQHSTVQDEVGDSNTPICWVHYTAGSAPTDWTQLEVTGHELIFYHVQPVTNAYTEPQPYAHIKFGGDKPTSTITTRPGPGMFLVHYGTRIKVPQGFTKVWFCSADASYGWSIGIIGKPNIEIHETSNLPDKYSSDLGDMDYMTSAPTLGTDGVEIPEGSETLIINLCDKPTARLSKTVTAEVWFLNSFSGLWVHNPSDDFDSAGLGDASASHDVEVWQLPPYFSRVAVYRTNAAADWQASVAVAGSKY